jgi:uncharacterized ubiquitin-like protein YukD
MGLIKLNIYESNSQETFKLQLPDTATGQKIIEALMMQNKIKSVDSNGNQLTYSLVKPKPAKVDITKKTILDSGLKDGDQVILFCTIVAASL